MSLRPLLPQWSPTSLDSAVTKVTSPLVAVYEGEAYPSGTACIVAPWLALTARHVIEDHFQHFAGRAPIPSDTALHETLAFAVPFAGRPALPLFVKRTWYLDSTDIAVLLLCPASPANPNHVWDRVRVSVLPPRIGSKLFSFGYPNSSIARDAKGDWVLNLDATTSTGTVVEVHHERRDSSRLSFPCFRTDARFDGSMSGGPVFNEDGALCGLVCSNLPPTTPGGEHVSYVSTLWPMLSIPIDAPWDRYPSGHFYPLYEYAVAGVIDAIGIESVKLRSTGGKRDVTCTYDVSAYAVSA